MDAPNWIRPDWLPGSDWNVGLWERCTFADGSVAYGRNEKHGAFWQYTVYFLDINGFRQRQVIREDSDFHFSTMPERFYY